MSIACGGVAHLNEEKGAKTIDDDGREEYTRPPVSGIHIHTRLFRLENPTPQAHARDPVSMVEWERQNGESGRADGSYPPNFRQPLRRRA